MPCAGRPVNIKTSPRYLWATALFGASEECIATHRSDLAVALCALKAGVYRPRIGARFPLERTADAHVAQDDASVTGKIVIDVGKA